MAEAEMRLWSKWSEKNKGYNGFDNWAWWVRF